MKVTVLTLFEKVCECQAQEVILPGEDGEISVLNFHQSFLSSLLKGAVQITPASRPTAESETTEAKKMIHLKSGIAIMQNNELTILATL
jgi:F0F1-type ATP synthase epsilon subunit